jgi:hypothetical protein
LLFINNSLFHKKFLKSLDIAKVFWSRIDFGKKPNFRKKDLF